MKLNYETAKKITCGAARVTEDDGFRFYRFTEEQEEIYRKYRSWFIEKTFSAPGVCLNFRTNSRNLYILNFFNFTLDTGILSVVYYYT